MAPAPELQLKLNQLLNPWGFECHPFKIDWYNRHVKPGFQLDFPADTLAFVIISRPSFFEKCFIPFVCSGTAISGQDPLDQSVNKCLKKVLQSFSDEQWVVMYDYEMRPGTRRPKVLVQTAGHVSGAVYFYQKSDIANPPWPSEQGIYGVCLHPEFVGWFAIRAVVVFPNILAPDLVQVLPKDILADEDKKVELLNRYNFNWQDWSFRDILEPVERYSDLQRQYFTAKPCERGPVIEMIIKQYAPT